MKEKKPSARRRWTCSGAEGEQEGWQKRGFWSPASKEEIDEEETRRLNLSGAVDLWTGLGSEEEKAGFGRVRLVEKVKADQEKIEEDPS